MAFVRSSIDSLKWEIAKETAAIVKLNSAICEEGAFYPGWPYEENSSLGQICTKIYKDMYQKDIAIHAVHAGGECGIIKEKLPSMDIVSMEPILTGCHTPEECLDIPSCERTWKYFLKVLENLK